MTHALKSVLLHPCAVGPVGNKPWHDETATNDTGTGKGHQREASPPSSNWLRVLKAVEFGCKPLASDSDAIGARGVRAICLAPKLSLYKIFNYVLKILYLGCQWKELPIDKDGEGHPETHDTRIYRIWRRWVDNSCMEAS
jgi:hypothetical protein